MIRRVISLVLVLMMLANQGLCIAHTHQENKLDAPRDHGSRPHIHLCGHTHHGHGHHHHHNGHHSHSPSKPTSQHGDPLPVVSSRAVDHDSDALYLAESVTTARRGGSTANVLPEKDDTAGTSLVIADQTDSRCCEPLRGRLASSFDGACPIYLRALSLRL